MILPQSNAFRTLNARLNSVPALALLQMDQKGLNGSQPSPGNYL